MSLEGGEGGRERGRDEGGRERGEGEEGWRNGGEGGILGSEGGREGGREGGSLGREGGMQGGREGGRGGREGWMTAIHILIGMFKKNYIQKRFIHELEYDAYAANSTHN